MATKAKESAHIRKVRKKLEQHLAAENQRINADALKTMKQLIERQIQRNKAERIDLKSKVVTLFDENQHPAKTESRFVTRLTKQLTEQQGKGKTKPKQLEGRVKAILQDDNS